MAQYMKEVELFAAHSSHTPAVSRNDSHQQAPRALSFKQAIETYLRSERALVELFTLLLTAALLNSLCDVGLRLLRNDS